MAHCERIPCTKQEQGLRLKVVRGPNQQLQVFDGGRIETGLQR